MAISSPENDLVFVRLMNSCSTHKLQSIRGGDLEASTAKVMFIDPLKFLEVNWNLDEEFFIDPRKADVFVTCVTVATLFSDRTQDR